MKPAALMVKLIAWLGALVLALASTSASAADYVTYLHADVLGSPILATDEQGNVVWQEEFEPWGARQVKDPAAATASRGSAVWYTGKEEEASLGMYYYGARWYSPEVGAFTAVDPAEFSLQVPRSFNRYNYARNSPLMFVDPDGRWSVAIQGYVGIGGGFVVGFDPDTGRPFSSIRLGLGIGGGVTVDPLGARPGRDEAGQREGAGGLAVGGFAEASVGYSTLGAGVSGDAGLQDNGYNGFEPYASYGPEVGFENKFSGAHGGVAGGFEFTVHRGEDNGE